MAEREFDTENAEFLRRVLDHANDIVVVLDAEARIRYASASARWILALEPHEMIGLSAIDLVHPEDREDAIGALGRSLAAPQGPLPRKVLRLRHGDGSWRWIELASSNLLDDSELQGFVVTVREVATGLEGEAQFRAMLAHSSDIVAILDVDGTIRWSSAARTRLLGYPSGDTEPDVEAREMIHPDDLPAVQSAFLDVLAGDVADLPVLARVQAADGAWHHLEMMTTNLLDDPNVRGVVVTSRDVTERVAAEHSLREEEARFRLLVKHAYDAIVTLDLEGICRYASPATMRVLGYAPEKLIGTQLIDQVHPEDLDRLSARVIECLQTPNASTTVEYRSLHADGSWRTLETVFTNLLDEPAVRGLVGNLHDVTELRDAQQILERQAMHDPLTDLPNRKRLSALAEDALERASNHGRPIALLYIDLDGFKPINDELGHREGDMVLETVARRLRHASRASDVVARLGGDEFCVLCEADRAEAVALADRLREQVRQPIDIGRVNVAVDSSIGVALAWEGSTMEELVPAADAALRRAKRSGKGRVEVYDPHIDSRGGS